MNTLGANTIGQSITRTHTQDLTVVTSSEAFDYVYGTDKIFQVGSVVFRVNDSTVLTAESSNVTSSVLSSLQSGTYVSTAMDRFVSFPVTQDTITMFDAISSNPTGYTTMGSRIGPGKFWGHVITTGTNIGGCFYDLNNNGQRESIEYTVDDYYIFGIRVSHHVTYGAITFIPCNNP